MRTRTRTSLALALALGLIASLSLATAVFAAETTLNATLAGDAETDEDGTGTASVVLDPDAGTACWTLTAEGIDPVVASHIHVGAAGENGDVAVNLDLDGFEGSSEGCTEDVDAATLQAVIDNPAGYYVNLHTEPFPGGAIRGQLAATNPNTALPAPDRSVLLLGALFLALAGGIALRTWRPLATRD
jgi:hypothetical protein